MVIQKSFGKSLIIVAGVLLLNGCSSMVFPDFADNTDVIIDDGGKVELRKVSNDGILVADKENAVYDDENADDTLFVQKTDEVEKAEPAKTIKVKTATLDPVEKELPDTTEKKISEIAETKKVELKEIASENVITKEEKYIEQVAEDKQDIRVNIPTMHYLAETIYFDNGSDVVDYKFYSALKNIAKTAKDNNALVSVNGYASSRTRNTDPVSHKLANFNVSARRADNVVKVLRKYGVKSDRIISRALSDTMPVYQEVMPEGERLNRRVEIYLTY